MTQTHSPEAVSAYPGYANSEPKAEEVGVRTAVGEGPAATTAGEVIPPASPAVTFLELPKPPSVNAMFRNVRRRKGEKGPGRVETKLYRDWQGHAAWRLREQRPTPVRGTVLVVFNIERTSDFADVDNCVKATLDFLVEAEIIDDDRFVSGIAVAWSPPRDALMRIAIVPAADLHLQFHLASDRRTGGWFMSAAQSEEEPS